MTAAGLTLFEFLEETYLLEKQVQPSSADQLRYSVRAFEAFADRPELRTLSDAMVNRWLLSLEAEYQPKTIKRRRGDVLAVWRYAAEEHGLCDPPKRVRVVRVPKRVPVAWTEEDMTALAHACRQAEFDTYLPNGLHLGTFFESQIRALWDTGIRLGDSFAIPRSAIRSDGSLIIIQAKTGVELPKRFLPFTLDLIDRLYPEHLPVREMIWSWPYRREQWHAYFRRIVSAAGLSGGTRKIRRASASYVEQLHPGRGSDHLGHATPGLARQFYFDPRITQPTIVTPPELAK